MPCAIVKNAGFHSVSITAGTLLYFMLLRQKGVSQFNYIMTTWITIHKGDRKITTFMYELRYAVMFLLQSAY